VDRTACVDAPALPLQWLLRRNAAWRGEPAVVVDRDAPSGVVLWANEAARRAGVLPGLRYTAGLALCSRLRAGAVSAAEIERGVETLLGVLRRFSPHVEPCAEDASVFWLDVRGLQRLHPSLEQWASELRDAARAAQFHCAVVVGFRRFASSAIAKTLCGARNAVFATREDEERAMLRVPLRRLELAPRARDALDRLGVRNLGDLLALPVDGLARRFGRDAQHLHRLASGVLCPQFEPRPVPAPAHASALFDFPESDRERLLERTAELCRPLLAALERRGERVRELCLELELEGAAPRCESLRPAEPTLAWEALERLLYLRLERTRLARGVLRVALTLHGARGEARQLGLFVQRPRRDLAAAARAFAGLRAAFGDDVVVRAKLVAEHWPECAFEWQPLAAVGAPRAAQVPRERPLVRRIASSPAPLSLARGAVERWSPPVALAGRWWADEIDRRYAYAALKTGELLWLYDDRCERRWYVHARL
jgi:protein ImuB